MSHPPRAAHLLESPWLEEHWDDFLAGRLPTALAAHLESCASCREIAASLTGRAESASPEGLAAENLTAEILAATRGPACGQPSDELCLWVDGELPRKRAEQVRLHVACCQDCRVLTAALRRLQTDLAEVAPPRQVVRLPLELRVIHSLSRALARAAQRWQELLLRPRFALEAAYVGTLVLAFVFALPGSPWSHVPARALDLVHVDPVAVLESAVGAPRLREHFAALQERASERGTRMLSSVESDLGARYRDAREKAAEIKAHGEDLAHATLILDADSGAAALGHLGNDLGDLWRSLLKPQAASTPEPELPSQPADHSRLDSQGDHP